MEQVLTVKSVPKKRYVPLRSGATLEEVARLSGVARSTVSGVINERADCRVTDETRKRIFKSIRKLNYTPNWSARSLRKGTTATLGMVGIGVQVEIAQQKAMSFERAACKNGFVVLNSYDSTQSDGENRIIKTFLERQVDGLLVYPDTGSDHSELYKLVESGFPVVTANGSDILNFETDDAGTDYQHGGLLQARHALECGYKEVCYLHDIHNYPTVAARMNGASAYIYEITNRSMSKFGIDYDDFDVCDAGENRTQQQISDFLSKNPRIDCLIAQSDTIALYALRAAIRSGRRVPEDLGVIGFDNIRAGQYSLLGLTTVGQRAKEIGKAAYELLSQRLSGQRFGDDFRKIKCKTDIIARETTRPLTQ